MLAKKELSRNVNVSGIELDNKWSNNLQIVFQTHRHSAYTEDRADYLIILVILIGTKIYLNRSGDKVIHPHNLFGFISSE